MPLTPEEITQLQEALTAGNYSENENIKTLSGLGLKIRTEAEENSFLSNKEQEIVSRKTSEFATNIEKDVLEATGIEKKPGEKYHEYLKRATSEIKGELATLKAKGGNTSEADRQRITELESLVKTKDEDFTKTLNELKGSYAKEKVTNVLDSTVTTIRNSLKQDTPFLDDIVTARVAKFNNEYKAELKENGALVFTKNADGKTALNTKTGDPLTAAEILGDYFKDLQNAEPAKKTGAGSTGGSGSGSSGPDLDIPADVKTKTDLATWFKTHSKLTPGSKEYNDAYAKYSKDLPLR